MTDSAYSLTNAGRRSFPVRRKSHRTRHRAVLVATGLLIGLCSVAAVEIRWAASSNRIYITGPGSATLSDIVAAQDQAPLEQVAPGVWHLRANLIVEAGAQLVLHGTSIGGDVSELRLQSNNATNSGSFVFINADWGAIHIQGVTIRSWDDAVNGPDTEYATFGRAYLGVRSSLATNGVTPLESSLDILDSDLGYLGYDGAEAYGVTWKVIGTHPNPALSIYDYVNVYGNILNSRLHHNYFGMYSFGHYAGHWVDNEVDHNIGYGFDPHDDSDYVLIENNHVHNNGWDGIIASKRCDHLTIRNNVSRANGQNGIILHRSSNDCLVENNQSLDNGTTGIVLTGSSRSIVRSNLVLRNYEAGVRLDLGSADNVVVGNVCASNVLYGFHLYKGYETPEPDDDGRPKRNLFAFNLVQSNGSDGINLSDSDDNTFATNVFSGNSDTLRFERGFGNRLDGNSISADMIVKTFGSGFDAPTTYLRHQPLVRVQVDAYSTTVFEDAAGRVFDPEESGVATMVTATGSTLTLTAAEIGTASTVVARSLWGQVTQGTVFVNPTVWTNGNDFSRQWVTQAGAPTQSLTHVISDLAPNRYYLVRKNNLELATFNSGTTATITFADIPGTSNAVLYSVELAQQMALERSSNGWVLSWTGGTLLRATNLAAPHWQTVPVSNGQSSLSLNPSQPMEFFRTIPAP